MKFTKACAAIFGLALLGVGNGCGPATQAVKEIGNDGNMHTSDKVVRGVLTPPALAADFVSMPFNSKVIRENGPLSQKTMFSQNKFVRGASYAGDAVIVPTMVAGAVTAVAVAAPVSIFIPPLRRKLVKVVEPVIY